MLPTVDKRHRDYVPPNSYIIYINGLVFRCTSGKVMSWPALQHETARKVHKDLADINVGTKVSLVLRG